MFKWFKKLFTVKQTCLNCRFNNSISCVVSSYYAKNKGMNVICFEGELWESK